jgi:hypothetical protein
MNTNSKDEIQEFFENIKSEIQNKSFTETSETDSDFSILYGLQAPDDFAKLMKTPAGEMIRGLVSSFLSKIALEKEFLMEEQRLKTILEERLLAFMLMRKHSKEHDSHLYAENQKQIDELLKSYKASITASKEKPKSLHLERTIDLIDALSDKIEEHEELKQEALRAIDERYELFHRDLDILNIDGLHDMEGVTNKINNTENKRNELLYQISQSRLERNTPKHRVLINAFHSCNIQLAALNDLIAVKNGTKILFAADGFTQVKRFDQATYICTPEKKIIRENGELYLIPALSFGLNNENRQSAKQALQNSMVIKELLKTYKTMEHQDWRSHARKKLVHVEKEIHSLSNQLGKVKAAQASASNEKNLDTAIGLFNSAPVMQGAVKAAPQVITKLKERLSPALNAVRRDPSNANYTNMDRAFNGAFPMGVPYNLKLMIATLKQMRNTKEANRTHWIDLINDELHSLEVEQSKTHTPFKMKPEPHD